MDTWAALAWHDPGFAMVQLSGAPESQSGRGGGKQQGVELMYVILGYVRSHRVDRRERAVVFYQQIQTTWVYCPGWGMSTLSDGLFPLVVHLLPAFCM